MKNCYISDISLPIYDEKQSLHVSLYFPVTYFHENKLISKICIAAFSKKSKIGQTLVQKTFRVNNQNLDHEDWFLKSYYGDKWITCFWCDVNFFVQYSIMCWMFFGKQYFEASPGHECVHRAQTVNATDCGFDSHSRNGNT